MTKKYTLIDLEAVAERMIRSEHMDAIDLCDSMGLIYDNFKHTDWFKRRLMEEIVTEPVRYPLYAHLQDEFYGDADEMEIAHTPRITVTIEHDSDAECPLEYQEGIEMFSFNYRHNNYRDPRDFFTHHDQYGNRHDGPDIGLRRKLERGTAVILSAYEHGNIAWSLQGEGMRCRFDTTDFAGIMLFNGKPNDIGKTLEERLAYFKSVIEEYTKWANGNVYWYSIEDTEGKLDDSCGGFIGSDYLEEELRKILKDIDKDDIVYKGDASWIGDYV